MTLMQLIMILIIWQHYFNYDPIWQKDHIVIRCDWLEYFLFYKVMPRLYAEKDCCTAKVTLISAPKFNIFRLKCLLAFYVATKVDAF